MESEPVYKRVSALCRYNEQLGVDLEQAQLEIKELREMLLAQARLEIGKLKSVTPPPSPEPEDRIKNRIDQL